MLEVIFQIQIIVPTLCSILEMLGSTASLSNVFDNTIRFIPIVKPWCIQVFAKETAQNTIWKLLHGVGPTLLVPFDQASPMNPRLF